jgi:tetratricopeptide (TPR) repeat protein
MEMGGVAELIIGDPDAAERWLADGIVRLEGLGAAGYLASHYAIQSVALARGGRFEQALEVAARAAAKGSAEDALLVVTYEIGRATALLGLGDLAGAVDAARAAVGRAETTDWLSYHGDALLILAAAHRASGDEVEARTAATHALDLYTAKEHLPGMGRAETFLASGIRN